jgi:hypothetical protein
MKWRIVPRGAAGVIVAALAQLLYGCASSGSGFVNPDVDFGYMRRAAVLPFENLTQDDLADERMQSVFLMEMLEAEVLDIVDPREAQSAMLRLGLNPGAALTAEQAVALGKELQVDGLFFGVVEEYGQSRTDRRNGPEVTAVFGMTETETGSVVWRSQVHATGMSFWKRLFGGGPSSLYAVSRDAVRRALGTLL